MTKKEQNIVNQVEEILDQKIRPALKMHAGGIDIVSFEEKTGVLKVRMHGACSGCGFADDTLYGFVEEEIRANIPDVQMVEPEMGADDEHAPWEDAG